MRKTQVEIKLVDVFTNEPFQGNPVAVILYGEDLELKEKTAIVRELNCAQAAFISDADDGQSDFRINVYDRMQEIGSNYPAIIATAYVMIVEKHFNLKDGTTNIIIVQTQNGVFPVVVETKGRELQNLLVMLDWNQTPEFKRVEYDTGKVAEALEIPSDAIRSDILMQGVKMNKWSMIVPVKERAILEKLTVNKNKLFLIAKENEVENICLVVADKTDEETKVFTKIFTPNEEDSQIEDKITGQSNSGIAAFLFEHGLKNQTTSKITTIFEQKSSDNRKGEIIVEMDIVNDAIKTISIGGKAIVVLDGKMKLKNY
jgi:trans-2,3-dihydro-3-hydroxyanthranilate isomerase